MSAMSEPERQEFYQRELARVQRELDELKAENKFAMPTLIANDLGELVEALLGEEKGNRWWDAPNPEFGGLSPKEMWFTGLRQKQQLTSFILDAVKDALPDPEGEIHVSGNYITGGSQGIEVRTSKVVKRDP